MKVVLFDRSFVVVSKEQGQKLMASLNKSTEGFVMLNETMVKKSAIAKIEPGGYTEADMPKPTNAPRLKADNRTDEEQYKSARKAAEIARKRVEGLQKNRKVSREKSSTNA